MDKPSPSLATSLATSLGRRRSAAQIDAALAAVARALAAGRKIGEACAAASISVPSYYRWRNRETAGDSPKRSRELERTRQSILQAAKRVFLRDGYRANLDAVAAEAGVARQTLYNHYGSKEKLFADVVQDVYERMLNPLIPVEPGADLIETLTAYGRRFIKIALDPESLALLRVSLAEYRDFPDLAKIGYMLRASHAVPAVTDSFAVYLQDQIDRGTIKAADPILIAESFFGALTGHARHRALVGVREDTPERLETLLRFAVELFVAGLGYRPH